MASEAQAAAADEIHWLYRSRKQDGNVVAVAGFSARSVVEEALDSRSVRASDRVKQRVGGLERANTRRLHGRNPRTESGRERGRGRGREGHAAQAALLRQPR